ncbi:hypothetical protein CVT24_010137 [Panaeolus cyanescens]|uniref:Uncharacterized protein n=1 Tax=Panaeolus cyanescens TaxID=181874 RepID=A0A409W9I0_9AGAR|nr:hypothetical protein CVT24_010137 [Panaeolus cyanescens]
MDDCTETEFTRLHSAHRRISWPSTLENVSITLPKAFLPLLVHNDAPSLEVAGMVETYRESLQSKEHEAHKRILALQRELDVVKKEQQQLAKKSLACDIILSIFRRLPNDIIYEILTYCPSYSPSTQNQHVPTILSHVSKAFRETIHGMSAKWRDLRVRASQDQELDSRLQDQLGHFDRLSGPFPLKFTLGQRTLQENWVYHPRLKTLAIESAPCSNPSMERLLQLAINQGLAEGSPQRNIQSLVIHAPQRSLMGGARYTTGLVTCLLDHLPSLHHLWLGSDFGYLREMLSIPADANPWSRLTRLFMAHRITADNDLYLATLLALLPQLEVASFTIVERLVHPDLIAPAPAPIVHGCLKELGITFFAHEVDVLAAFRSCFFPALTSLWLEFQNSRALFKTPSTVGLSASSIFPVLKSLSICDCSWGANTYDNVALSNLFTLPTICDLNVYFLHSFKHVLGFLSLMRKPTSTTAGPNTANSHSPLFPNISYLNLHVFETSETCQWGPDTYYSDGPIHNPKQDKKPSMVASLCHAFAAVKAARTQTQIKVEYMVWPDADDLQPTERANKDNSQGFLQNIDSVTILDHTNFRPITPSTLSSKMITFYDIALRKPVEKFCCAVNPWKTRYALNFKGVPYSTTWVPLTDVAKVRSALKVPPCRKFADGTDFLTLPIIQDHSTDSFVGDSFDIAVYLQEKYPNSGAGDLFPPQNLDFGDRSNLHMDVPLTQARQGPFPEYAKFNMDVDAAFTPHIQLMFETFPFDPAYEEINRAEFVRRGNATSWEDFALIGKPRGERKESFKNSLSGLAQLYLKDRSGPFVLGTRASYADLIVGGWLMMMSRALPESEWNELREWHSGVFGQLHDALHVYTEVK